MKKSFLLIGCLALLVAGCSREKDVVVPNENPQEGPERHLVVNITVNQEDPDTRVVKTDWEAGDKVYVAFGKQFGDPSNGKAYYLTLTYDGQKWNSAFSDPGLEALLLRPTGGYLAAAYTSAGFPNGEEPQFACLAPEDQNELARLTVTNPTPGFTMGVGDADYYVEDSGLESVLNATLNMKLIPEYAMVHLFIEGVSEADAGRYSFENEYIKPVSFDGFQTVKAYNSIQYSVNPLLDYGGYGDPIPADYYKGGIRFRGALDPSMNGRPARYVIRVTDNRCTPEDVSDDLLYTFEPANEVALGYRKSVKLPPLNSGKWTVTGNSVPEVRFWLEGDPDNYITEVHFAKDFGSASIVGWGGGFLGDSTSSTVTCSEDWLYCSMSGWHISLFTYGSNDSDEPRVATITVTVTDGIDTVTKTLTVYQDGANSPIRFESDLVKSVVVQPRLQWDANGDVALSYAEAAAVTSLGGQFKYLTYYYEEDISFRELKYFTGLTSIEEDAFLWNPGLLHIELPSSITSIGDNAFTMCSYLEEIWIPEDVITIGDEAFAFCSSLEEILIPEGVTTIGNAAFEATSMKSFHLPASVTEMPGGALIGCNDITEITVDAANPRYYSPSDRNAIIETSTKTLVAGISTVPEGVKIIGANAFNGRRIHTIDIPATVTEIGAAAFYTSPLESIYDFATEPQTIDGTFVFSTKAATYPIYVPALSVDAYKAAWPYYADRIKPMDLGASFEKFNDEKEW